MAGADSRPLVAHVVYRFAVGGLENGVVNLINRMPPERYRHAVIALTDVTAFRHRVSRDDVEFIALHKPPGHGWRLWPHLYRTFRRLRPAIVHSRNLAALESVVPAAAAGVPIRIHGEHGRDIADLDGTNRAHLWTRRAYRPFVHRYVALSRDLHEYLRERVGVGDRVRHIWNGVDTQRFRPAGGARAPLPGCPFDEPGLFICGTVGRLELVKDPLNLVHAFLQAIDRAAQARERLRLVLVGAGSLADQARRMVAAASADRLVWFAGERNDVAELMRGLDLFALPSLAEGISNTILEAMASGLPVIATRVGANADMVEDGMSGRVIPPADSSALAEAILQYLHDPALARRHGRAGRQIAERRFGLDRMVDEYDRLYAEELQRRGMAVQSARAHRAAHTPG
jgi:sugar transferase (PEP-CTERM/EpsH1 system associated)